MQSASPSALTVAHQYDDVRFYVVEVECFFQQSSDVAAVSN